MLLFHPYTMYAVNTCSFKYKIAFLYIITCYVMNSYLLNIELSVLIMYKNRFVHNITHFYK